MTISRRRFLTRSALGMVGVAGSAFAFPGDSPDPNGRGEALPDGSAAKGMITTDADRAIDAGLAYLAARRNRDGSFGTNPYYGNVAVTSLAALAFMAGGHLPGRGVYGRVVSDALLFVMSQENVRAGHPGFLHNPSGTPHGPMYGHGFGTLFLAEVYGMVHDRRLRDEIRNKLRMAVDVILTSQNLEGGWRYYPERRDADLSVTVCQIMALRAARNAGFRVPKSQVDHCIEYVKRCQDKSEGWFRYMQQGGMQVQPFARTAAGVAALFSAGLYTGPEVERGLRYLKTHCLPGTGLMFHDRSRPDMHYFYGHYYAVQAMWTAGGAYWAEWYPAIRNELVASQQPDGSWVDQICSHYATAMACIILQVPNNYLPIMQK
jgi:hypothetical protein